MEVKLFENDTSEHLEENINTFLEQERPVSIDKIEYQVTPSEFCHSGLTFSALILYENKATTQVRRKSFDPFQELAGLSPLVIPLVLLYFEIGWVC